MVSADLIRDVRISQHEYRESTISKDSHDPFAWTDEEDFDSDPARAVLNAAEQPALLALDLAATLQILC